MFAASAPLGSEKKAASKEFVPIGNVVVRIEDTAGDAGRLADGIFTFAPEVEGLATLVMEEKKVSKSKLGTGEVDDIAQLGE